MSATLRQHPVGWQRPYASVATNSTQEPRPPLRRTHSASGRMPRHPRSSWIGRVERSLRGGSALPDPPDFDRTWSARPRSPDGPLRDGTAVPVPCEQGDRTSASPSTVRSRVWWRDLSCVVARERPGRPVRGIARVLRLDHAEPPTALPARPRHDLFPARHQ
jgi:hypothetical protein